MYTGGMEPKRAVPQQQATRYGWAEKADGEWWQYRDAPEDTPQRVNALQNDSIKHAAYAWAKRHGYRAETRVENRSRSLFIRFHKEAQ